MSLYFVSVPPRDADNPATTLIIMHGYGADEFDLLPIAKQLDGNFNIISLQAPMTLDWGGYSWYHLSQTITGIKGDDPSRHESIAKVISFLKSQMNDEKLTDEVILMGFSQGAAMCYSLLASDEFHALGIQLKAVIALSGYIPLDARELLAKQKFILPVFISHGLYDDLIPPQALDSAKELLEKQGATVTAKTYEVGHGLTEETIADINRWLLTL